MIVRQVLLPLDTKWLVIVSAAIAGALALFADPWLILASAVAGAVAWLGWSNPGPGIGIVAATVPVQEALLIPIGSMELTATQLTLLPLAGGWCAAWLTGRTALRLTPVVLAWGMVSAAMVLSGVNAVDRGAWIKESYRWTIALVLLVIAVSSIRRVRDAWPVVIGTSVGIAIATAVALWQVIQNDGPPSFSTGRLMRAYGYFGEPNPLAAYLEMSVLLILPVALLMMAQRLRAIGVRYGLLLLAVAGVAGLMLTQSRGGLLGLVAGASIIAWYYARWTRLTLLACVLIAIPLLAFTEPGANVVERFSASVATVSVGEQTTPENWSVHERMAHWRAGWSMIESKPLAGIGAGNFDARFREHTEAWRFRIPRGHAHNGPIHVAAQTGFSGLVPYLALFFLAGARIARGVAHARSAPARALSLGAMGVLIAVIVHGQFDYLHGLSLNVALVIALAMSEPALHSAPSNGAPVGAQV